MQKPEYKYKALSITQVNAITSWLATVDEELIVTWAAAFGHPIDDTHRILCVPGQLADDPIAARLFDDLRTLVAAEQSQRLRNAQARAQAAEWRTLAQQMEDEDAPDELAGIWNTIIKGMRPLR